MSLRILCLVALAVCSTPWIAARVAAQAPAPITGFVYDTIGSPIAAAEVLLVGTNRILRTDDSGSFRLVGLTPGRYGLHVRRLGYRPRLLIITVADGNGGHVAIRLAPQAAVLERVTVAGERGSGHSEFERRRNASVGGGAVYLTRTEIERANPGRVTDLFYRIPGVRVWQDRRGLRHITMTRTPGLRGCPPTIYLDGVVVPIDSNSTTGIDFLHPLTIEGMEVYRGPSEIPPELNRTESACGVVVIWTRSPSAAAPPPS